MDIEPWIFMLLGACIMVLGWLAVWWIERRSLESIIEKMGTESVPHSKSSRKPGFFFPSSPSVPLAEDSTPSPRKKPAKKSSTSSRKARRAVHKQERERKAYNKRLKAKRVRW